MKKKMMLTVAAVAMVGTLAVGGTLAWFTDTETATNVVTTGDVDIQWIEDGTPITKDYPGITFEGKQVPGAILNKNATIKNVGENAAYVRASIDVKINDEVVDNMPAEYVIEVLDNDIVEGSNWEVGDDGYFYYLKALEVGKETDILVGKVEIAPAANDIIADQKFEIILNAEAIQVENLPTPEEGEPTEGVAYLKNVFGADPVANKTQNDEGEM